jgi:hypothetical protein
LKVILFFSIQLLAVDLRSQVKLSGRVYEEWGVFPLQGVSVMSNAGNGVVSDSTGHFSIYVNRADSVYFSYLGKETRKFALAEIPDTENFIISLRVNIPVLKEVKISPPDYHRDSMQYRADYAKAFNYRKPTFRSVVPVLGFPSIVVDIDELIRVFGYRQKRMMLDFQKRVQGDERQHFISHRFTKRLVGALTGLQGEKLDSFMIYARPGFFFTTHSSDYEFRKYIMDQYFLYMAEACFDRANDE